MSRLPVLLVGAGTRASTVYAPLLTEHLADRIALVGVVGRGEQRARALGERLGVPWSTSLEAAAGWGAQGAVVAVSSPENAAVAHQVLDRGLAALLETPLALDVSDAEALAARIAEDGAIVEVAEQNPRFPDLAGVIAAVRGGAIGDVRLVASDGAGYRYHAAAVARALLGKGRGRVATGQRAVFPEVDVGRGVVEEVLVGTVRCDGGLFQFRDAEAAWAGGPWSRGTWRALGTTGEWANGRLAGCEVAPIEWLPGLDGDLQAAGKCLLDWLARIDGTITDTAWSAADALADLRWIEAMQRSAILGGAPIAVYPPQP